LDAIFLQNRAINIVALQNRVEDPEKKVFMYKIYERICRSDLSIIPTAKTLICNFEIGKYKNLMTGVRKKSGSLPNKYFL